MAAKAPGLDGTVSILFDGPDRPSEDVAEPAYFADLRLDLVVQAIVAGRAAYRLEPFFRCPLPDVETVRYRHEVLRDLDDPTLVALVDAFAEQMRRMRLHLDHAKKVRHPYERQRWFLEATSVYCAAVTALAEDLAGRDVRSRGFLAFREHLTGYAGSDGFRSLGADARDVVSALAGVRYRLHIRDGRVTVSSYAGETDYTKDVEGTFAKFKQGSTKSYLIDFWRTAEMNHIEARIVELVARLNSEPFDMLAAFARDHETYLDAAIARFDREVQFYIGYLRFIEPLEAAGLRFCLPRVSRRSKDVRGVDAFDLALADKLVHEGQAVVSNDFSLEDPERVLVVTGPNQGGKTTFARMVGQLHHLAGLGLPVPGREARLFLPDTIFTHFEREEDIETLSGKLQDELLRLRKILREATGDSLVIMNETFASTTLDDALYLGREVMRRIVDADMLCVYVTFIDELTRLSDSTVSLVSTVDPDDPVVRTFRIERRPADGLAYAMAIAEKYALTFDSVRRRVAS